MKSKLTQDFEPLFKLLIALAIVLVVVSIGNLVLWFVLFFNEIFFIEG